MKKIMSMDVWNEAKRELSANDPIMSDIVSKHEGMMSFSELGAFGMLSRSIIGQQISNKAAKTIWERFQMCTDLSAEHFLSAIAELEAKQIGLSRQKYLYITNIASFLTEKNYTEQEWHQKPYQEVYHELNSITGVGTWTFEMFAIFYLRFADVLPTKDLVIRRMMEKLYNNGKQLTKAKLNEISTLWTPWKTVVTWYLWKENSVSS